MFVNITNRAVMSIAAIIALIMTRVSKTCDHGHFIAKGGDINSLMAEIYGKEGGICKGRGGSMHVADFSKNMLGANGIVGAGPPLALGVA